MEYVGNYDSWLQSDWVNEILNSVGVGRPKQGKRPTSVEEEQEYQRARSAGYKDDEIYFYMFDKSTVSFILDIPFVQSKCHWWITKMMPGNFMPMHVDPHTLYETNSKRYWMPWQDYELGHIFMYEDQVITNYKRGDVYSYKNPNALHGAANIGFIPRIVLQVSTYE